MADVTGGYTGSPEDERWTRRGSGAGKFQIPGTLNQAAQAQGMAGDWLENMKRSLGLNSQVQLKVTGDVGSTTVEPTYGGAGRGSGVGGGRVTVGATGGGGGVGPQGVMANIGRGINSIPTGRLGLAGGLIPGVTTALSELGEGRPVGAAGALLGAGVGGVTAAGAARFIPSTGRFGLIGKAAQIALPFLGAQIGAGQGAQAAEYGRQSVTKIPTKGNEGDFSSQLAAEAAMGELGATQYRNQMGTYTSAIRDLQKYSSDLQFYDLKRNMPLVNQMKNADLIRQQSLIASQGQQLSNLSVLSTAGQLATGGQAETGATIRTMLTANPYANAVLRG
jgi:hypothetical protein